MNRDVIVIGASTGGLQVLLGAVGELPANLPASIFIVVHTSPDFLSPLPDLLSTRGALPAVHPFHGQIIERGRIFVAPADNQLIVRNGFVEVVRGPKENGHRPAVDALFRSASWAYGPPVIGVGLSGYLDCGTAGLMSIKARGGVAVAQDPATAVAADMPRSVIERVGADHVVNPLELPGLLVRLVNEKVDQIAGPVPQEVLQLEGGAGGKVAELVCPLCQGVLREANAGGVQQFRCHVGHAFSMQSLLHEQTEEVERALWAAVRSLEEGAALSSRLASREHDADMRGRYAEKQDNLRRQADVIREILLFGNRSSGEAG